MVKNNLCVDFFQQSVRNCLVLSCVGIENVKVIADTRYRIEQRAIRLAREEAAEAVRKKQQEELDYEMARIAAVEATL